MPEKCTDHPRDCPLVRRVEALEDDVALLKSVIKSMSQRLNDLEKAQ